MFVSSARQRRQLGHPWIDRAGKPSTQPGSSEQREPS
jgi:hypothetical protein